MTRPAELTLTYQAKPMLENQLSKKGGWYARNEMRREWRQAFAALALEQGAPSFERVSIVVEHTAAKGRLPDVGSCAPSTKAAVDGLVDAGVLVDDGPSVVLALTYLAPERGPDALTLKIMEVH